jgi:predicted amidohydrolase
MLHPGYTNPLAGLGIVSVLVIAASCFPAPPEPDQDVIRGEEVPVSEWMSRDVIRVAAGQVTDDDDKYDVMMGYIARAGSEEADLIVLPEYIAGTFSRPLKDTDAVLQIAAAARENSIYVIVGGWEELEDGAFAARKKGAFANTALLFNRQGEVIGRYSKMHEAVGESPHWWPPLDGDVEWIMKPGEEFPVFQTDFGRVGIMICYDGYFPEPPEILSLHGAELVAWINARTGSIEEHLVKADIQRNYVAVIAANRGEGAGTMIAESHRTLTAHVDGTGNHYISGDIDLKSLRERRAHSRVHHQRKPELYGSITERFETWKVYRR